MKTGTPRIFARWCGGTMVKRDPPVMREKNTAEKTRITRGRV